MRLEPGAYLARFRFATGKSGRKDEKNTGLLRVLEFPGGRPLAESFVQVRSGSRQEFVYQDLPFLAGANQRVEVHVGGGKIPLWLDSVQFISAGQQAQ
jgi:hypothetical protein